MATTSVCLADVTSAEVRPGVRSRTTRTARIVAASLATLITATLVATSASIFLLHLGIHPVLSGSMRPAITPGSVIVTKPMSVASLRPGMVIIFSPPGQHDSYAHRVVSISGSPNDPVITTKGDANRAVDPWRVQLTQPTVPRVLLSVPVAGSVIVDTRAHPLAALIGAVGLLVAVTGTLAILRSGRASEDLEPTNPAPTEDRIPRPTQTQAEPNSPETRRRPGGLSRELLALVAAWGLPASVEHADCTYSSRHRNVRLCSVKQGSRR